MYSLTMFCTICVLIQSLLTNTITATQTRMSPIPSVKWSEWANKQVCQCTNLLRSKYRLPLLTTNYDVMYQCIFHSVWMAKYQRLEHQRVSTMPNIVAENIAYTVVFTSTKDVPQFICNQWIKSPRHRANMLSTYATHCSAGFASDPYGVVWATQLFSKISYRHSYYSSSGRFLLLPHSSPNDWQNTIIEKKLVK